MATVTSSKRQLTHTSNTYESNGDVTIGGNLSINGTTTTIDTANLLVEDKNIIIGDVSSPSDSTADGGGITLKGASDKTINWVNSTDSWTSNQKFSAPSLTLTGLTTSAETTALLINGSNQVVKRTLGSNAFNSTSFLTGNQTITLSGDVSGSGTTSISVTVADDSHNHIISNVDGLQSALDGKLSTTGKAADSNLLDNIDSTRFIYGDNATGTSSISGSALNPTGSLKSGFYRVAGTSSTIPNATSVNFVLHTSYDTVGNKAGFDLAVNDSTSSKIYFRPSTGGGRGSWQTIWTDASDGSGSGLDADLLDGNQASAFATASHTHAASDITSGTLADARIPSLAASKITSGTLSNSRLDNTILRHRGTLDLTSSSGGNNGLPFDDAHTETRVAEYGTRLLSYTGASATMLTISTGGSASVFQIGAHYNGNDFYMRTRTDSSNWQTWKKLWHAGNDGSGSGLDADLLDGNQASAFATASHTHAASDITSGTLATARIPSLAASKITSGTFADARIASASNWNTAYTDRNKWDGGSTGLNAATGRTSLGLGSAATSNTSAFAAAGDENIIDGAAAIWNADGDGDVFHYNDSNPVHNGKSTGAVLNIRGDGANDHSLVRAGIFTSDHVSTANGYYVGTLLGTANSTTTQVINNSGEWTGSVIPAAKLSTATTQASSENSTKIATTAYVKSQSYLTTSGKAADSNLLDGIDSSAFLRSNAADTASGVISFTGGHGAINITNSSILSSATSNWTGNPGGAGKIQYHSNRWYIVSDSSSNRVVQFRRNSSDVSYIANNGDFIGNVTGALTGNASTATTLATARTIAGTSFNGSANINISYNNLTNKPTIPSAYSLPLSSSSTRGGVKIGFSESGKNYPVELDSSEKMFVNVPWVDTNTDTNTTYSAGTGITLSGTTFSLTDTASKLSLSGGTMTGTLNSRDIKLASGYHLQRSNHHSGHLEGSYNNVGANGSKSNPIYTIGSGYNPSDAALVSMYGIGYSHTDASFISFTGASGWGQYVAADGDARIFLCGSNGVISSTGQHYVGSSVVWNAGNDGSGSGLDADLLDGLQLHTGRNNVANRVVRTDGNGYIQAGWINTTSGNNGTTAISRIYASQDGYIRYYTPANFGAQIGSHISYNDLTNKPTIPSAYSLPLASSSTRGGVKIGFAESGKNYPVELDSSEKMFVNVPWVDTNTDTNTTYSAGRGLDLSGTQFQLETDLRDSVSHIGYDSGDYVQWSNNSYFRSVVNGSERFRVNTSGIDVTGSTTSSGFLTDTTNTQYNLLTRNHTSNTLYVQAAQSGSTQGIASFRYGSATANAGTEVLAVRRNSSYFINTKLGVGTSSPQTSLDVSGTIHQTIYNATSLPSASPAGQRAFAYSFYPLATSHGSVVSTNGSYVIPVYSDGSSWRAG